MGEKLILILKKGLTNQGPPLFAFLILSTETELLDDIPVSLDVLALEVIKNATTFTYELQKCTACAEVLLVVFQMLCKVSDTVGK